MSKVTSAHLRKWLYDITWHKLSISISLKAAKRRRGISFGQVLQPKRSCFSVIPRAEFCGGNFWTGLRGCRRQAAGVIVFLLKSQRKPSGATSESAADRGSFSLLHHHRSHSSKPCLQLCFLKWRWQRYSWAHHPARCCWSTTCTSATEI